MIRQAIPLGEACRANAERKVRSVVVRRLRQAGMPLNRLGHVQRGRVVWFDDYDANARVFFWADNA